MTAPDAAQPDSSFLRYAALSLGVLVIGLVGFLGFVIYPNLDLSAGIGAGLIVLAAAAGVASFFSPCSFALLVGLLGRPISETTAGDKRRPIRESLAFATLALLGSAIALGGDALIKDVTFTSNAGRILRIVVGTFMIVVGLIQVGRINVSLRHFEPTTRSFLRRQRKAAQGDESRGLVRYALFGFGYLAAGFG